MRPGHGRFSRDDVEGAFFSQYLALDIFATSPFETLDQSGVGELVRIAVERGRAARPELTVGVCGEHGGDPASVRFFHHAGLDYVSCSPFRVPIARAAVTTGPGRRRRVTSMGDRHPAVHCRSRSSLRP
jgi:phosphoenolpyruvate synthase/pyruvate phosphate dikinase